MSGREDFDADVAYQGTFELTAAMLDDPDGVIGPYLAEVEREFRIVVKGRPGRKVHIMLAVESGPKEEHPGATATEIPASFKSHEEFARLVAAVDLTKPAIAVDFGRWQMDDGTREGLLALVPHDIIDGEAYPTKKGGTKS